jgi:hypothetical protein
MAQKKLPLRTSIARSAKAWPNVKPLSEVSPPKPPVVRTIKGTRYGST